MKSNIILTNPDELQRLIKSAVDNALKKRTPEKHFIKKEVFTNRDAMNYLDVSRATLQRWREEGILPYSKVSGSIFYTRENIESLFESNREEG